MPMAITTMYCWSPLSLLVLVGTLSLFYLLHHGLKGTSLGLGSKKKLPPGPKGFPILGCLPMLGRFPHLTFHKWAKQYGHIMHMKLGHFPTVVVSSPQAALQFLKTHDLVFASRPLTETGRLISYNYKAMSLTPYGMYWRNIRKLCTLELLSSVKIDSFRPQREEEVGLLVGSLKEAAEAHEVVDLTIKVGAFSRDMTNRMVMGKKYMEDSLREGGFNFKEVSEEVLYLVGAFNIAEFIPWTRDLDLQGLGRRMRAANHAFDIFLERIIDEHVENKDEKRQKDFVDYILSLMDSNHYEFEFDRSNMKAILLEMVVAATDTTFTTMEWTLSELIKNPSAMKKAQQELETMVGKERVVDESDLVKLDYLDMVIKESMRLHPPAPLLLPHESMEDCTVCDFHIPKGSRVLINAWAIGRDPDAWPNPDEFSPERFIGTKVDVRGRDFQLVPFGSGRRGCPGMQLGLTVVKFGVAQLIHCFDWELPNGMSPADLDMTEKASLVMPRAHHLLAIPTYRLNRDVSP
ncbi:cytochrome P450 CYP736A12-like protein [Cinnamomum micranthum f. kanehirae]|uniref:Cytochrome P450 CYP736A12-like protein n=1 Tax=Cinnamomum micranthum f. kanehirae TaxID=337451 RepID=A0A443Q0Z9_9MAGN|nr:cytochrome P450 CYP736A12-like protein [Cinnamomum micranthum f. kanehirae]